MKNTFLLISIILFSINAQANNFSKYYKARENFVLVEPIYLKPNEQPELEQASNWDEFNRIRENLISKGYVSIGNSQFLDYKIPETLALDQAKKVKATYVLTIKEIANDKLPYRDGDDLNKINWAYKYTAIYAVKDQHVLNYKLGLTVSNLNSEETKKFQRNTGVIVLIVYENKRAYIANILKDDIITKINEKLIINYKDFERVVEEELNHSKTLNLSILRLVNGQLKELTIPINFD